MRIRPNQLEINKNYTYITFFRCQNFLQREPIFLKELSIYFTPSTPKTVILPCLLSIYFTPTPNSVKIFKSSLSKFFTTENIAVKIFKSVITKKLNSIKSISYFYIYKEPRRYAQKIGIIYKIYYPLINLVTYFASACARKSVRLFSILFFIQKRKSKLDWLGLDYPKSVNGVYRINQLDELSLDYPKSVNGVYRINQLDELSLDYPKSVYSVHRLDQVNQIGLDSSSFENSDYLDRAVFKQHGFAISEQHGFFSFKGIRVREG